MKHRPKIDWVICAAGHGRRFVDKGILVPKPQLILKGRSMLERAASCLPIIPGDQLIILMQEEAITESLRKQIRDIFPWVACTWIGLKGLTKGQLATVLKARRALREGCGLGIWNCDTYFRSSQFDSLLSDEELDGLVPCGRLSGSSWSFFKESADGLITEVREKKRISPWASVGLYYFRDGQRMLRAASQILRSPPAFGLKEHYVASVYPLLIARGLKLKICPTEVFLPFGTPEQVKRYWGVSRTQLRAANRSSS